MREEEGLSLSSEFSLTLLLNEMEDDSDLVIWEDSEPIFSSQTASFSIRRTKWIGIGKWEMAYGKIITTAISLLMHGLYYGSAAFTFYE